MLAARSSVPPLVSRLRFASAGDRRLLTAGAHGLQCRLVRANPRATGWGAPPVRHQPTLRKRKVTRLNDYEDLDVEEQRKLCLSGLGIGLFVDFIYVVIALACWAGSAEPGPVVSEKICYRNCGPGRTWVPEWNAAVPPAAPPSLVDDDGSGDGGAGGSSGSFFSSSPLPSLPPLPSPLSLPLASSGSWGGNWVTDAWTDAPGAEDPDQVRDPTTWTTIRHDGPDHLGL